MKQWSEIRERVLLEGESRRQIIRETGGAIISWKVVGRH